MCDSLTIVSSHRIHREDVYSFLPVDLLIKDVLNWPMYHHLLALAILRWIKGGVQAFRRPEYWPAQQLTQYWFLHIPTSVSHSCLISRKTLPISHLCMDSLARLSSRRVKWHRGTSGAIQFMAMVLSTIIMPPIIRWDMHVKWLATNLKNKEQALWKCLGKVTEDGLWRLRVSWCW